jgi:hypothetical protein
VQRLGVGVYGHKLHALNTGVNHAVDRCAAGATYPYDLDTRKRFNRRINCLCHGLLPLKVSFTPSIAERGADFNQLVHKNRKALASASTFCGWGAGG